MLIQFLVPHYHETYEQIRPLLTSIALQQGINFDDIGVIICNDGDDVLLDEDNLKKYPFEIQYKVCEHRGVSATRQACFDMSTADYVMFCDADDMFIDMLGVYDIINRIIDDGFDMLISSFIEEERNNDEYNQTFLIERTDDLIFVHGKVFRRQYIIDQNIKWIERFKVQEDSYFVYLSYACLDSDENIDYVSRSFYFWKYREGSITSHKEYEMESYPVLIDVYGETIKELLRRGKDYNAQIYCIGIIYDLYYLINTDTWLSEENKKYKNMAEKRLAMFYKEFKDLFESSDEDLRIELNRKKRNIMLEDCSTQFETITFNDWIKYIETID